MRTSDPSLAFVPIFIQKHPVRCDDSARDDRIVFRVILGINLESGIAWASYDRSKIDSDITDPSIAGRDGLIVAL